MGRILMDFFFKPLSTWSNPPDSGDLDPIPKDSFTPGRIDLATWRPKGVRYAGDVGSQIGKTTHQHWIVPLTALSTEVAYQLP
jgi:hypothetical protein